MRADLLAKSARIIAASASVAMSHLFLEKSAWPPGDVRLGVAVKMATILAVVEAVVIGALIGGWWCAITGTDLGLFYGLLAMYWPIRWFRALSNETQVRQRTIVLWSIIAIANGLSAIVVASTGLGETWWLILPLYGVPLALGMGPATVDLIRMGKARDSHLSDRPEFVDLCKPQDHFESVATRKLWSMIILLALKDRADEIRLEPQKRGMLLRMRINGQLIELVAPAAHMGPQILREIAGMAGLRIRDSFRRRARTWLGFRRLSPNQNGIISFQLDEVRFEGQLSLVASRWWGENVILRLPVMESVAEQAAIALRAYFQSVRTPRVVPSTGIEHIPDSTSECVLATIAMAAGVDRNAVAARRSRFRIVKYVTYQEITALLKRLTGVRWRMAWVGCLPGRLDRVNFPNRPVIVFIYPQGSWRVGHCILVKGQYVHDPYYPCAVSLSDYMWGNWRVGSIYQPDCVSA